MNELPPENSPSLGYLEDGHREMHAGALFGSAIGASPALGAGGRTGRGGNNCVAVIGASPSSQGQIAFRCPERRQGVQASEFYANLTLDIPNRCMNMGKALPSGTG